MPGGYRWQSADAECPYYKDSNRNSIRCEGLLDADGCSTIQLNYALSRDRAWHEKTYCEKSYRFCPIYAAVMSLKDEG